MLGETDIGLLPGTCVYGFKLYLFYTPPMTGAKELAGLSKEPPDQHWTVLKQLHIPNCTCNMDKKLIFI